MGKFWWVWWLTLAWAGVRIGEAANPGPSAFDDPEPDGWLVDQGPDLGMDVEGGGLGPEDESGWLPEEPPWHEGAYDGAASGSTGRAVQHVLGQPPVFVAASKFTGPRQGMVFKLDVKGLGYYRDESPRGMDGGKGSRRGFALVLDEFIPAAGGPVGALVSAPLGPAADTLPSASRRRAPARSRRASTAGDPRTVHWADEAQLADPAYKGWGPVSYPQLRHQETKANNLCRPQPETKKHTHTSTTNNTTPKRQSTHTSATPS